MPRSDTDRDSLLAQAERLRTDGKPRQAVALLKDLVGREQQDADLQYSYAMACHDAGDLEAAEAAYRKVGEIAPGHVKAHSLRAAILRKQGQPENAIAALRMALKADPRHIESHNLLVMTLADMGRLDEVREQGRLALQIKDEAGQQAFDAKFKGRYALATNRKPRPKEIKLDSRKRHVISFSLWGTNPDYTHGAIINARIAPYLYPGWVCRFYCDESVPTPVLQELRSLGSEVVMMPAGTHRFDGLFWRFFVSDDPEVDLFLIRDCDSRLNSQEKVAVDDWLASDKPFHIMRDHPYHNELILAGMWGGAANVLPSIQEVVNRHFSATENRHSDQAFLRDFVWPLIKNESLVHDSYFRYNGGIDFPALGRVPRPIHVGGAIKGMPEWNPPVAPVDANAAPQKPFIMSQRFDRIRRLWEKQLFFIAATEKSGTTWLQIMLNAHPEIACRGEGHFFSGLMPEIRKAFDAYSSTLKGINEKVFGEVESFPELSDAHRLFLARATISSIMAEYGDHANIRAVGEKTPGNIRRLRQLKNLFPTAKLIFMLRDGRDIAISGWFHLRRQWGEEAGKEPIANYARRLAEAWRNDIDMARAFSKEHPEICHWVRYEDLLTNPNDQMERVLKFLGMNSSPEIVKACVAAGDFKQLSHGRDRGQENISSHFRKGVAGDWRNHFDAEAISNFDQEAGDLLREFGYAD